MVEKIGQSINTIHFRQQRPNLPEQGKGPAPWEFRHMYVESDRKRPAAATGYLAWKSGVQLPTDSISSSSIFFPAFASFGSLVDRHCMAEATP